VLGYLAWNDWRTWQLRKSAPPGQPAPVAPPSFQNAAVNCALFLAVDVVAFGAPLLGTYAGLVLVFWLVPRALLARKDPPLRRHRVVVALITVGVIAVDIGAHLLGDHIARTRITAIADALVAYKARNQSYPAHLKALVPVHLPEIPTAKPMLLGGGTIHYLANQGDPALMFTSVPPFGREYFRIETREWTSVD